MTTVSLSVLQTDATSPEDTGHSWSSSPGDPSVALPRGLRIGIFVWGIFYSSLGYCMECMKLLSSQMREGFPICSAFLPYLQTHLPLGMTWDLLGLFERLGQMCGMSSHLAMAPRPQPHSRDQLPASAPGLSVGPARCLSRALGSQLRKRIWQETIDFFKVCFLRVPLLESASCELVQVPAQGRAAHREWEGKHGSTFPHGPIHTPISFGRIVQLPGPLPLCPAPNAFQSLLT